MDENKNRDEALFTALDKGKKKKKPQELLKNKTKQKNTNKHQ